MSDQPATGPLPHAALAGRVTRLARLLEAHPAFDLLAEYEAIFLDRHACAAETVHCLEAAADDLMTRIDAAIALLEAATERPPPQPAPSRPASPAAASAEP